MSNNNLGYIDNLQKICEMCSAHLSFVTDEIIINVEKDSLVLLLTALRDNENITLNMLISICGVDYLAPEKRFEVIYNLLSIDYNYRARVKVRLAENEEIPSIQSIFAAACWFERETFDMYGINFTGGVDHRRLLTDYEFEYFPLRKDFPLTGYDEVRYDEVQKKVIYEPVSLDQEYRSFDFLSPWEGSTKQVLPGDEKASLGTDYAEYVKNINRSEQDE